MMAVVIGGESSDLLLEKANVKIYHKKIPRFDIHINNDCVCKCTCISVPEKSPTMQTFSDLHSIMVARFSKLFTQHSPVVILVKQIKFK